MDSLQQLREENARLRDELTSARTLLTEVLKAEDGGRRRIAQLIHDDSLQSLLAANQELMEAAPGREQVQRAHEVVEGAIARLREAMMALHPVTLEQGGFREALGAVARQAARQGSFEIEVVVDETALEREDELMLAVARELLTNVARHAGASRVEVVLRRNSDALELEVSDDGRGIDPGRREQALSEGHIGLASVAERVKQAGGTFELESSAGGTRALARIPDSS